MRYFPEIIAGIALLVFGTLLVLITVAGFQQYQVDKDRCAYYGGTWSGLVCNYYPSED